MTSQPASIRCAYETAGQAPDRAPTIVFVHSLGADREQWRPQLTQLASDFHLVALDLRGHGRSPVPEGPYTIEALRDDVLALTHELGYARFHYCGISIGGMIGLALALHAPERLCSLAISNTAARIGSEQSWRERSAAVHAQGMIGICPSVVPRWFGPRFAREQPGAYAASERTFCSTDPRGYRACCAALQHADLRARIASITVPTWIGAGELDLATPPEQARALHTHIAGSELHEFAGAAHLANLDCASQFSEALARFVRKHDSRLQKL